MHLEAVIEQVWRCPWRPTLRQLRDALGGRDRARLEMHLEAETERVCRCNWGPTLSELRDALGGRDWVSLVMHLPTTIEWDWRSTGRRSIWGEVRWPLRLYSLGKLWWRECRELSTTTSAERWDTGRERETVDLGIALYQVYALLGVHSWLWHTEIERNDLTLCSKVMVEVSTRKREIRGDGGSDYEKLGVKRIWFASQLTITDPAGNDTNKTSSKPYQESHTGDFT